MMNIATYINHATVSPWHFTQRHADAIRRILPDAAITITHHHQDFIKALRNAHVALAWTFRQEWFQDAPLLRVLSTPAAGKDYFKVIPPPQVTMLNGHFHGQIIAETVVGMILSVIRGILPNATTFGDLPWARHELTPIMRPLRNAHVTILGFGNIGRWIGKLLKPFGTHIWGLVRNTQAERPDWFDELDDIGDISGLDRRLQITDHLILALPSTTGTDNIMDRRRLRLLPRHATIVNIGRGNALDEQALIQQLRQGLLLGAVLDVFQHEPLPPDDPLRTCPNLWLLPHASAISDNYLDLYAEEVARDLLRLQLNL